LSNSVSIDHLARWFTLLLILRAHTLHVKVPLFSGCPLYRDSPNSENVQ
jgi:hypothetical protein